jgi:hypothetical protein
VTPRAEVNGAHIYYEVHGEGGQPPGVGVSVRGWGAGQRGPKGYFFLGRAF